MAGSEGMARNFHQRAAHGKLSILRRKGVRHRRRTGKNFPGKFRGSAFKKTYHGIRIC